MGFEHFSEFPSQSDTICREDFDNKESLAVAKNISEEVISYAKNLIQYKAQQLVGLAGLTKSDVDDLKQEMWVDLLRRFSWFESDRAKVETFIDRVLSNCAANIIRHRCGDGRDFRLEGESLNGETADDDGQTIEFSQTLAEDVHDLRTGSVTRSTTEQLEFASDVQSVLDKLPAPLRELCQLLKIEQISIAARKLGITRHEAYERLDEIREHFKNAGLDDYLCD